MAIEGGCYCGAVRYEADGDPVFKAQCHCRECQYFASGSPNVILAMPEAGFAFTKGKPKTFIRTDLDNPVTREFCGDCGTSLTTRSPGAPGIAIVKVGTLDDPAQYEKPDQIIWVSEKQAFHNLMDGVQTFEQFPVHE